MVHKPLRVSFSKKERRRDYSQEQIGDSKSAGAATRASDGRAVAAGCMIQPPSLSERVSEVINVYAEGLKQIVIQRHHWVLSGWARRPLKEEEAAKGRELLEFLGLAPSSKNARKVLEICGIWKSHFNVRSTL